MDKRATEELREIVARALAEDIGPGDVTSEAVVPAGAGAKASIVQKQPGVLFGLEAAAEALAQAGGESFDSLLAEGQWREDVPVTAARASGPARALLAGERVALNLLGHLSGIATLTAQFVRAVEGTGATVLDTRKTTPGLRVLEKAAVAAGGGVNHRLGLYDAILIKDNHAAIAGGVSEAVRRAREARPELPVEVECRDLEEVRAGLEAGADRLLLDNMEPGLLLEAVELARAGRGPAPALEASGGITLANVAEVASSGVEFVSVGALTHSAPTLDVSMELQP
ncbi:MAG: carboxylating nicotinate-nucleotide diphosphorylase [Actinomycetota bacterium]|nr:carboxylating nicotinate-nucleotide diphosphorylase [Actinomycetota bacterium]